MLLMSGCQGLSPGNQTSSEPAQIPNYVSLTVAEKKLAYGVLSFEEGNYPAATIALQGVLVAVSAGKQEQVKAYKYLAFIHCVSGRETQCRDSFKKALETDPLFSLDSAEVGHPTWGPVFRGVKSKFVK